MTAAAFVLAGIGVVLIWSAVVGEDPREVFASTFRGTRAADAKRKAKEARLANQGNAGGGGTYPASTGGAGNTGRTR